MGNAGFDHPPEYDESGPSDAVDKLASGPETGSNVDTCVGLSSARTALSSMANCFRRISAV